MVKNPPANSEESDLIPWWGRSPGGGHSNPYQYSCQDTPMDRGAQWGTVPRVAKNGAQRNN